jgi:hypothetical protein
MNIVTKIRCLCSSEDEWVQEAGRAFGDAADDLFDLFVERKKPSPEFKSRLARVFSDVNSALAACGIEIIEGESEREIAAAYLSYCKIIIESRM